MKSGDTFWLRMSPGFAPAPANDRRHRVWRKQAERLPCECALREKETFGGGPVIGMIDDDNC